MLRVNNYVILAVLIGGLSASFSQAAYIGGNQVNVQAKADVTYDADTGLYTYNYAFTNATSSRQEVDSVVILLGDSSAINVMAPKGWGSFAWNDGNQGLPGNKIEFATVEVGQLPADYVDDPSYYMRDVPSIYQIKPGQTLSGFSFQSPDPPGIVDFYAQGFTQIPDVEDLPDPPLAYFDASESVKGQTKGPKYTETLYSGNRRPATDGFLVFKNLVNRDTKLAPVQVDIKFGLNGETVDQNTFKAYLNSQDVTAQFKPTGEKTRRAVFQPNQLAIGGRNTLLTTVQGIIPSNGRTASDVDRVVFTVQP